MKEGDQLLLFQFLALELQRVASFEIYFSYIVSLLGMILYDLMMNRHEILSQSSKPLALVVHQLLKNMFEQSQLALQQLYNGPYYIHETPIPNNPTSCLFALCFRTSGLINLRWIGNFKYLDYFIKMPKFEKTQISCHCLGTRTNTQTFFLARKRQSQDCQSPQFITRVVKTAEIKHESEGKTAKRSLKRRPGSSNIHDHNPPNSDFVNLQADPKPISIQEIPMKARHHQILFRQIPTFVPKNTINFKFPQTTASVRLPPLINRQKDHTLPKSTNLQFTYPLLSASQPIQPTKNLAPLRYSQLQFKKSSSQRQEQPHLPLLQNPGKDHNLVPIESRHIVSARQNTPKELSSPTTPFYSSKYIKSVTQDWSPPIQDPLLAQDFQKIFRNKQENPDLTFTKGRKSAKPREVQKSKRFQQQQLMGRFAQSEDEAASESHASQVIGKGFDLSYQDFLDEQQPLVSIVCEQTKASRSTNTKVSNLRGERQTFDGIQKRKFVNLPHFASFDRL